MESPLCKTLGGVEVPMLTITNFQDEGWDKKKHIVIQGRIHPGETSSSWIIHGLISFLIGKSKVANELRKRLVFKIIPMCNPDGVIIGNHRTSLLGKDMNRQYRGSDDPKLNPVQISIKDLVTALQKDNKVLAFIDVHQHSKKKSIFLYGPYFPLHSDKYIKVRLIPKILSEITEMFRYYSCRFRSERYKESCARITMGKIFNVVNCFCLECSSFGFISKDRVTVQFGEKELIEFGRNLCESLLEYCLILEHDRKVKEELKVKIEEKKKKRKQLVTEILGVP